MNYIKKIGLRAPLLGFLFLSAPAFGQSDLGFPRVIATAGYSTRISVQNPTSAAASVTFTAWQPDGSLLVGKGLENPTTGNVPARGHPILRAGWRPQARRAA